MHFDDVLFCGRPENLLAIALNESVVLKWDNIVGADGYRVYMHDSVKKRYNSIKYTSVPEKVIYSLTNNIEYRFKVKAYKLINGKEVYSDFSKCIACTPAAKGFTAKESFLMLQKSQIYTMDCLYDGYPTHSVEYSSSNEKIVTVDQLGNITAVSSGEAVVTAFSPIYRQSAIINIVVDRVAPAPVLPIGEPRFICKDGLYTNPSSKRSSFASIVFTGDIMCISNQQKKAFSNGTYHFIDSFRLIRPFITEADFAIGTLETMLSTAHPYASDKLKVDGKPNCNAPSNFLDGVHYAGFDAVVTATNHSCDTELTGIEETLSHIKEYNLLNLGIGERYFIVEINGIKVAFFAYTMVTNNRDGFLNEQQKESILCIYSKQTFEDDYESARRKGAEFSIVMIHWGIMNSTMVRDKQVSAAKEMADVGADYIIGSHPHVLQKADIIKSYDGKEVPVLYSLGNFISSMREMRENTNTMILQLNLEKKRESIICSSQYIPCVILQKYKDANYVTAPVLNEFCNYKGSSVIDMLQRIDHIHGIANHKLNMITIENMLKKLSKIAPEAQLFRASCSMKGNTLLLDWQKIEGADGYRIYSLNKDGKFYGLRDSFVNQAEINIRDNNLTALKIKAFRSLDGKREFIADSVILYPFNRYTSEEHELEIPKAQGYSIGTAITGVTNAIKISSSDIPLISFVVPVFNDEQYLERLFHSILRNTIINCEVVVVNDGSTDNSQEIIENYCEKFPQVFRSIVKDNGGVAEARNTGVAAARGKYIGFIDSDDCIRPQTCELFEKAIQTDSDIIISAYYKYHKKGNIVIQGKLPFEEYSKRNIDLYLSLLYGKGHAGQAAMWNKLYRAELIRDKPIPSMSTEDVAWSPYIASYADSFTYINTPLYEYLRREGSTSEIIRKKTEREIFEQKMKSIHFFLENGNPLHKERLYDIAEKRLEWHIENTAENSLYARELERLKAMRSCR